MGVGESAVANNIMNETYRIQRWDFNNCEIPDISQGMFNNFFYSHVAKCKASIGMDV